MIIFLFPTKKKENYKMAEKLRYKKPVDVDPFPGANLTDEERLAGKQNEDRAKIVLAKKLGLSMITLPCAHDTKGKPINLAPQRIIRFGNPDWASRFRKTQLIIRRPIGSEREPHDTRRLALESDAEIFSMK